MDLRQSVPPIARTFHEDKAILRVCVVRKRLREFPGSSLSIDDEFANVLDGAWAGRADRPVEAM